MEVRSSLVKLAWSASRQRAQRLIHRDDHLAILVCLRIHQPHTAREPARNFGAGVPLVRELDELDR